MSPYMPLAKRNAQKGVSAAHRVSRWRCRLCAADGMGGGPELYRHYLSRHFDAAQALNDRARADQEGDQ